MIVQRQQGEVRPAARLRFRTARVSYGGPDRIQVTASRSNDEGRPFAPTYKLVQWGKALLERAQTKQAEEWAFQAYAERYLVQMRRSYVDNRPAWDALLAREHAVLCCYCNHPRHCHRYLLADYLTKLGATYLGDLG